MTEARHVQRVRHIAAGLVRQRLQVGGGVVMRHQRRVALGQQLFQARDFLPPLRRAQDLADGLGHPLRRQAVILECGDGAHLTISIRPGSFTR